MSGGLEASLAVAAERVAGAGLIRGYVRPITKPVAGTVKAAVAGVATAGFAVDLATGVLTFAVAPAVGAVVTAGFEFDVPVRFDLDQLVVNLAAFEAGDIPAIPLVEVRV